MHTSIFPTLVHFGVVNFEKIRRKFGELLQIMHCIKFAGDYADRVGRVGLKSMKVTQIEPMAMLEDRDIDDLLVLDDIAEHNEEVQALPDNAELEASDGPTQDETRQSMNRLADFLGGAFAEKLQAQSGNAHQENSSENVIPPGQTKTILCEKKCQSLSKI